MGSVGGGGVGALNRVRLIVALWGHADYVNSIIIELKLVQNHTL